MRLSDLRASLTLALLLLPLSASADVFINEIHYDNASTDEGEAIEVVATAGEDLSQYSIHYYTSASASTSDSVPASSPISCGSGNPAFGVINYPVNGLQNSGPKAMALVVGGSVIQFLSYEGALTATAGVANGLTSTDIGVAEDGGTAVGESLQLSGNGSTYVDFTWNSAATNTFGACNNGQTFGAPVDNPPTVNATDPAEGDTDIPVNSTLSVTFSEPVTATAGAFTLSCNDAGSIGLNVSGGSTTFTLTPATALDFNDSCTLTIVAANVTDQDAPADNMAADVLVHFDTEIDNAPTLTASTPSNGASDFQVNENLSLTFSEPVDVTGSWFQIICSVSGNRSLANVAVSGGPIDYSLDPASDFIAGENCTLTFNTSAVTDQDGSADTLVDPGSIAFVPVADAPPAVLSTTPTDGDSSFPSAGDIVVMFSEPVTLTAGAFDLSCNTSSGISLSHVMSGTSFTINTGTALVAGDACTFTVDRTKVTDSGMQNPAANTVVNFTVATSSTGTYYDTVNTSSPEQLRCTLHNIIKGSTNLGYQYPILEIAEEDPTDPGKILDVYRNCSFIKPDNSDSSSPGRGITATCGTVSGLLYNREHTWPKSLGFSNSSLAAHNDHHMLHLADKDENNHRGNKPYGTCRKVEDGCSEDPTIANHGEGGGTGIYPGNSNWYNNSVYEVWHKQRGDMARSVFYMAIRYEGIASEDANDGDIPDLELTDDAGLINATSNGSAKAYMGFLSTLLQWHQQDPVDDRERDRNVVVYSFQGNRNPFIDHPEWATMALFTSSQPATCLPNVSAVSANDDSYNATEDTLLSVAAPGVLVNDTADTSITGISVSNDVSHGMLSLNNDGSFSYTPSANYCGPDSFVYEATDGSDTDTATVSLTVACVEDGGAPAQNDTVMVNEDAPATFIDVLANDGVDPDPEQNPLTVSMVSNLSNGSNATIVSGGVEYTPGAGYCGNDSFDYTLAGGGSATVNVTIENCNNDAPNTMADSYVVAEDDSITVSEAEGVLANDSDPEGDNLTAVLDDDADFGTLVFNNDGSFTYTPNPEFCGDDGFSYHANDGANDSATTATMISVTCLNDAPVANADSYNGSKNTLLQVMAPGVLGNDTDVEMATLNAVLDLDAQFGSLTLATNGGFDYTPNPEYCGEDSFTYHANDGSADSATVQVTLNIDCLNQAPVAAANSYFGSEDAPFSVAAVVGVLANDSDANGDELTAVLDDDVQHGSLTLNADGSFDYAPDANYCGSDSFTYHANDGAADSNVATVTITVQCANDAPVSLDDSYAGTQDTLLSVVAPGVLDNDSDVENDTLEAILDVDAQHGVLSLNADGSFSYTPDGGFCGTDSFSYHANDGSDDSATANVTLTIACTSDAIFADGFE